MGDCKDGRTAAQGTAAELYQLAAMLLGDGPQAADVAEASIARTSIDPCAETEASVQTARRTLVETAITHLSRTLPDAFDAPVSEAPRGCIETDELASEGFSTEELLRIVQEPGRNVLRHWLGELPVAQRTIFVVRGILGWDNAATAASLTRAAARSWQPSQVGDVFRQALCSLATSLAQSAVRA